MSKPAKSIAKQHTNGIHIKPECPELPASDFTGKRVNGLIEGDVYRLQKLVDSYIT